MSQQKHIVLFVTLWILFLSGCSESFAAGQSKLSLTEAEKAYIAQIGVIKGYQSTEQRQFNMQIKTDRYKAYPNVCSKK